MYKNIVCLWLNQRIHLHDLWSFFQYVAFILKLLGHQSSIKYLSFVQKQQFSICHWAKTMIEDLRKYSTSFSEFSCSWFCKLLWYKNTTGKISASSEQQPFFPYVNDSPLAKSPLGVPLKIDRRLRCKSIMWDEWSKISSLMRPKAYFD